MFWRVLFNRFLVGIFLSDVVIAFMVGARGDGHRWHMMGAMIPLVLMIIGFKFYCKHTFDNSMKYYTKGEVIKDSEAPAPIDKESRRRDRVATRFGHPALFKKLTVPMVHKKSQHLLGEVYKGRLDGDIGTSGYSDVYSMKRMSKEHPGKTADKTGPFEFVAESEMDFENFKNRPEFSDDHGGESSIYGHVSRPGSPSSRSESERGRSSSRDSERTYTAQDEPGVTYPAGYHHTPSNLRESSPSPDGSGFGRIESSNNTSYQIRDETGLLGSAAPMGLHTPGHQFTPYTPEKDGSTDYFRPLK
jgi:hypothetical protein